MILMPFNAIFSIMTQWHCPTGKPVAGTTITKAGNNYVAWSLSPPIWGNGIVGATSSDGVTWHPKDVGPIGGVTTSYAAGRTVSTFSSRICPRMRSGFSRQLVPRFTRHST